jgi:hypothetical protein
VDSIDCRPPRIQKFAFQKTVFSKGGTGLYCSGITNNQRQGSRHSQTLQKKGRGPLSPFIGNRNIKRNERYPYIRLTSWLRVTTGLQSQPWRQTAAA